jgi:hypothetical protein
VVKGLLFTRFVDCEGTKSLKEVCESEQEPDANKTAVCLTCDYWKKFGKGFLGVTGHDIDSE